MSREPDPVIETLSGFRTTVKTGWMKTIYHDKKFITDGYSILYIPALKGSDRKMLLRPTMIKPTNLTESQMRVTVHRAVMSIPGIGHDYKLYALDHPMLVEPEKAVLSPRWKPYELECFCGRLGFSFHLKRLAYVARVTRANRFRIFLTGMWQGHHGRAVFLKNDLVVATVECSIYP